MALSQYSIYYTVALCKCKNLNLVTHPPLALKCCKFYRVKSRNSLYFRTILNMAGVTLPLYHSVDSILEILTKEENKNMNGVQEILEIYDNVKSEKDKYEAAGEEKKYPFIVLEGLDGSGKTSVGKRLAKHLNAEQWRTPPNSISAIRDIFDVHPLFRTAYYSLGNYIAALEVQLLLRRTAVIMDRYWHSTAAFALAQAVQDNPDTYEMPPKGDKIYKWPEDLLKPDAVVFLDVSERVRKERQSRRINVTAQEDLLNSSLMFRKNVIQAYKNMYNPGVITINGDSGFGTVLYNIHQKIKHLFKND